MLKSKFSGNADNILLSSEYEFTFNDYDWINKDSDQKFVLHSLLITSSFARLQDDLKIFSDIQGYKDLGFDLLVQREIDEQRVENEIYHNFLAVRGKLHFFPPLTVALIPVNYSGVKNESIESKIEFIPTTQDRYGEVKFIVGENYITERFLWEDPTDQIQQDFKNSKPNFPFLKHKHGTLRWDKNVFNAVIIDGQHRYKSLGTYLKHAQLDQSTCQVPLNILTLIPKQGHSILKSDLVKVARELFIDINKNAEKVSESRQILLDDRDLRMFLSRSVIRQFNRVQVENFYLWEKSKDGINYLKDGIPQEVVSWNLELDINDKENEKKFAINQITSTTLLYRIIREFILLPEDKNETIYNALYRVFNLNRYAPPTPEDEKIFSKIKEKKQRYDEEKKEIEDDCEKKRQDHKEIYPNSDENPFDDDVFKRKLQILSSKALDFDKDVNDWLKNWFFTDSHYGKFLVRFYTAFKPYHSVVEKIEPFFKKDVIDDSMDIVNFLIDPVPGVGLIESQKRILEKNRTKFRNLWNDLEELKKRDADTRKIIFQKSILSDLDHLFKFLEEIDPSASFDRRINKYIKCLNDLYIQNVFHRRDLSIKYSNNLFLSKVSEQEYELSEVKIWDGVWNDVQGNIMYKDSDAPKIGHLILILATALYSDLKFKDLKETQLIVSIEKVRDCYRTFYLNKAKLDKGYSNQNEVWKKLFKAKTAKQDLSTECEGIIEKIFNKIQAKK